MQAKLYRLFSDEQALAIREQLKGMEWKQGQARTKELTGTIKQNLEVKPEDGEEAKALSLWITRSLMHHPGIASETVPMQSTAFKFNNYKDAGTYNRHTDAPFMGPVRTDFAATVFLSDPDTYEGGELHIEQLDGEIVVKGRAGEVFVYECGNPHWVTPVTEGERISAIGWIQSRFPDKFQRDTLRACRKITQEMEKVMDPSDPNDKAREWFVDLGHIHSALFRKWST